MSLFDRIRGTLLGVVISLLVYVIAIRFDVAATAQLMIAVAVCAAIARVDRSLRTCMWTCPIVLLSGHVGSEPVVETGLYRALEIVTGCLIGAGCHFVAERVLVFYEACRSSSPDSD